MNFLICYDIRHPKRLNKVHKIVSQKAISVQLSVYTANLNEIELNEIIEALNNVINVKEDDIRIYPIRAIKSEHFIGVNRMPNLIV